MRAVVASGHIKVTEAATEILQAGGNAFDAVVAAGLASVVAEPALTSLGGGGFLIARQKDETEPVLYDFFVDTPGRGLNQQNLKPHFLPITVHFPGSEQDFNVGHGSVAVPGILRGLLQTHRKLGRLPLKEIVAPAVHLARNGLPLNNTQSYVLELLKPIMTLTSGGQEIFSPGRTFLKNDEIFKNLKLAAFLETLPESGDFEFYEGAIAKQIITDMQEQGGLLTLQDLASYRIIERKPLFTQYRGIRLYTNPPPSFGGSLLSYSLQLLQAGMLENPGFGTTSHLDGLAGLMQEVDRNRENNSIVTAVGNDARFEKSLAGIRKAFGGTTHVSIIDSEGNAAGLSCSNGEGSGYIVPDTGIMLNNMMGEDDLHPDGFHASPPGQRVASMMSPTIAMKDGQVNLVIGSGGSKRIRTAMLQVLSNIIDFEMPLGNAIEAPRLHWDGRVIQIEPGFAATSLQQLQNSEPLNLWQVKDVYFGGVHAVSANGEAAGDSRRDGAAATL